MLFNTGLSGGLSCWQKDPDGRLGEAYQLRFKYNCQDLF